MATKGNIIEIPDYRAAKLGEKFREMVKRRVHLKSLIDKAEEELGDSRNPALNAEIELALAERDLRSVVVDKHQVTIAENPGQPILSREKLLEAGVGADTIEECTVRHPYTYIVVTELKKNKERTEQMERRGVPILARGPALKKSTKNRVLRKAAKANVKEAPRARRSA